MTNTLYFGDNLSILRDYVKDESVDLIYLDPPFNKNSRYNVLFKTPTGEQSGAQVRAFDDTWVWENGAETALDLVRLADVETFKLLNAMHSFLGDSDVMAYIAMMAPRLLHLRRVLRAGGTICLHCDPTVSHYLKILMDGIFGPGQYINEISWKRTTAKADYVQGATHYPRVRDILLIYRRVGTGNIVFNQQFVDYDKSYLSTKYRYRDDDGRFYRLDNLTGPGGEAKGNPAYDVMGITRYWRYSRERMQELIDRGLVVQTRPGTVPQFKRYLEKMPGVPVSEAWEDIRPINSQAKERIGYPTQKPLKLLERVIETSSRRGDVVLDPFCGCGTAIHAAEKLGRQWIGIDITYLAIQVIQDRLSTWLRSAKYDIIGVPEDEHDARVLAAQNPYQFQLWAVGRVGGQPRGRGADRGIDGEIIFLRGVRDYGRAIISVKAGQNINPDMLRALKGTIDREQADMGVFICINPPTREMRTEAATAKLIELPGGKRPRVQIVTVTDLIAGPNLGIVTGLNIIQAAEAARGSRRQPRIPTPTELRLEPELPPMPIRGGRRRTQQPLPLNDPLLQAEPRQRRGRRRGS